MGSTFRPPGHHDRSEHCERCGRDTPHEVDLEVRTESDDPQNAAFSREPYRVTTCVRCGTERATRMSDV